MLSSGRLWLVIFFGMLEMSMDGGPDGSAGVLEGSHQFYVPFQFGKWWLVAVKLAIIFYYLLTINKMQQMLII